MWNQQPPAWGWPPNMGYQYQQDSSQGWAAAAALWAQQRQMQDHYQNGSAPAPPTDKPPEPPGPPPQMPPLPPQEGGHQPLPPQEGIAPPDSVEVHDYNHGVAPQVLDYQHNQPPVDAQPTDIIEYNHGQAEHMAPMPEKQSWEYNNEEAWNQNYQQQDGYYNQQWNQQWAAQQQENWNTDPANFYPSMPPFEQHDNDGRNDRNNHIQPSGFHNHIMERDNRGSGSNSPDITEIAKKSKSLPLWLRQGLEKLEKDKKKEEEKDKKEDIPNAKLISGYQMANSPPSSPERNSEDDNDDDDKAEIEEKPLSPVRRRKNRFSEEEVTSEEKTPEKPKLSEEHRNDSGDDSDGDDEEEKQRQLILKIKTWMTDILLSVTNNELQNVCKDVYFEMKRSAKTKGQQLRRSGGLDALRSGLGGDASSSEDEDEVEEAPKKPEPTIKQSFKKPELPIKPKLPTPAKSTVPSTVKRQDTNSRVQQLLNDKSIVPDVKTPVKSEKTKGIKQKEEMDLHSREEELKRRLLEVEKLRKKRERKSSESDEQSSDSDSESSDSSGNSRRKKKSKHHSRSRSPSSRKSRKKSRRRERDDESDSSDNNERRQKKKKKSSRARSSSSDNSDHSYRKKKSKGKKHKHKDRSPSRSPTRRKRKR